MKIALVRLSSLGDIILCMTTLQLIRQHLPESKITYITDKRFAPLLDYQPDIGQVVAVDLKGIKKAPGWAAIKGQLDSLRAVAPFDLVIDMHGMIKSAVVGALLGGRQCGFARRCRKESLAGIWYRDTYKIPYSMPATERYMLLVCNALGIDLKPSEAAKYQIRPYMHWGQDDVASVASFLSKEKPNILIVSGTSAANKNYPPEAFAKLANLLAGANLFICHGNDVEYAAALKIAQMAPSATVLPRLKIGQLKALVGQMDLVIGGDTGPTHLAMASGVRSITLFGATPVCFTPTTINRAIKTSTVPDLLKPDPTDFSVASIPAEQIAAIAGELLLMDKG